MYRDTLQVMGEGIDRAKPCSWRCEGGDHADCPDPSTVCSIENCYNERDTEGEYCRQCEYEIGCDAATDAQIDAMRDDA